MWAALAVIWAVLSYAWVQGYIGYLNSQGYVSGDPDIPYGWMFFPPVATLVFLCAKMFGAI